MRRLHMAGEDAAGRRLPLSVAGEARVEAADDTRTTTTTTTIAHTTTIATAARPALSGVFCAGSVSVGESCGKEIAGMGKGTGKDHGCCVRELRGKG